MLFCVKMVIFCKEMMRYWCVYGYVLFVNVYVLCVDGYVLWGGGYVILNF